MTDLFIKPEQLKILTDIFKSYCPNADVWAYGSRVRGTAHAGSDLDLAVKNFNDENCTIIELRELIQNSDIPFLVDINEFDALPDYFQKEILKKYVVIYG